MGERGKVEKREEDIKRTGERRRSHKTERTRGKVCVLQYFRAKYRNNRSDKGNIQGCFSMKSEGCGEN